MQKSSIITYAGLGLTLLGLVAAGLGVNPAPQTPELGVVAGALITIITAVAHHLTDKGTPAPPPGVDTQRP